jgi:hypothetical protein
MLICFSSPAGAALGLPPPPDGLEGTAEAGSLATMCPEPDDAAGDEMDPPSAKLPLRELSVTSLEMLADESTGRAMVIRGRRLGAAGGPEDELATGFNRGGSGLAGGASAGFGVPAGLT